MPIFQQKNRIRNRTFEDEFMLWYRSSQLDIIHSKELLLYSRCRTHQRIRLVLSCQESDKQHQHHNASTRWHL